MAIRQSSDTAIVNWQGFSIGEGARVDIRQPSASSAMLNRVTGSTPSSIAGQLNANGQVYLVNPNGIAITPTGTVQHRRLRGLDARHHRRGLHRRPAQLHAATGRSAAVVNQGSIEVGRGRLRGADRRQGRQLRHDHRPPGQDRPRRRRAGDARPLRRRLPAGGACPPTRRRRRRAHHATAAGSPPTAAGSRSRPPPPARWPARSINLSGVVEARSVSGRSGAIVLGGGDGGTRPRVRPARRQRRRARRALAAITPPPPRPERGGSITVTGDAIELAGATLDASGPAGGGTDPRRRRLAGQGGTSRAPRTTSRRRRHADRRRRPRRRRRRQRRRLVRRAHRLRRPHLAPAAARTAATAASPRSRARTASASPAPPTSRPLWEPSARCSSTRPTLRSSRSPSREPTKSPPAPSRPTSLARTSPYRP